MADSMSASVLIIRAHLSLEGEWAVANFSFEGRQVYESTKGLYIKNQEFGRVYLDEHSRAFLATKHMRVRLSSGGTMVVTRQVDSLQVDALAIQQALHRQFFDFGFPL